MCRGTRRELKPSPASSLYCWLKRQIMASQQYYWLIYHCTHVYTVRVVCIYLKWGTFGMYSKWMYSHYLVCNQVGWIHTLACIGSVLECTLIIRWESLHVQETHPCPYSLSTFTHTSPFTLHPSPLTSQSCILHSMSSYLQGDTMVATLSLPHQSCAPAL